MSFAPLFRKYKTDKPNAYAEIYDPLPPPERMLEIGVKTGGSLLAWAERWPDAEIYGLDISMALVRPEVLDHPRVILVTADAMTPVASAVYFDLIIDDGSHEVADQIKVLQNYGPRVVPGGIYVVEDIRTDAGRDDLIQEAIRLGFRQMRVLHPTGLEFRVLTLRKPS